MEEAQQILTPAQWAERLQGPPGSTPSAWDVVVWTSPWLERVQVRVTTPMPVVRMWVRTQEVERAARAASGELASNHAPTMEELARLLRAREDTVRHLQKRTRKAFWPALSTRISAYILLLMIRRVWGAVFVVVVCAIELARALRRSNMRRSLWQREIGRCGCGYDLRGQPGALPSVEALGVIVGPRICPECAAAWPLVPPPVV